MYRVFIFLFLLFLTPATTYGQVSPNITGDALSIKTLPQYPSPGEAVTATIDDYSLNTTGGTLMWYVNGVAVGNPNDRSVALTAPALGTTDTLTATIKMPNGTTMTAKKVISPLYLDLIIEPETYTPPFYEGRALPTKDSLVRATVLVHDKNGLVNPNLHSYTWKINGKVIGGGSRTGANQTTYTVPYGNSHTVTVSVSAVGGGVVAERTTAVPSTDVDVQLYEVSTLYGLSHRVVASPYRMLGNSFTVRAIPYNLDLRAFAGNLFTEWSINNQKTKTSGGDPFEISVGRQGIGTANINFKVRNLDALLQGGEAGTVIQF